MCCNRSGTMEHRGTFNQMGRLESYRNRRHQKWYFQHGHVTVLVVAYEKVTEAT